MIICKLTLGISTTYFKMATPIFHTWEKIESVFPWGQREIDFFTFLKRRFPTGLDLHDLVLEARTLGKPWYSWSYAIEDGDEVFKRKFFVALAKHFKKFLPVGYKNLSRLDNLITTAETFKDSPTKTNRTALSSVTSQYNSMSTINNLIELLKKAQANPTPQNTQALTDAKDAAKNVYDAKDTGDRYVLRVVGMAFEGMAKDPIPKGTIYGFIKRMQKANKDLTSDSNFIFHRNVATVAEKVIGLVD